MIDRTKCGLTAGKLCQLGNGGSVARNHVPAKTTIHIRPCDRPTIMGVAVGSRVFRVPCPDLAPFRGLAKGATIFIRSCSFNGNVIVRLSRVCLHNATLRGRWWWRRWRRWRRRVWLAWPVNLPRLCMIIKRDVSTRCKAACPKPTLGRIFDTLPGWSTQRPCVLFVPHRINRIMLQRTGNCGIINYGSCQSEPPCKLSVEW